MTRGAIAPRVTRAGARWLGRTTSTAAGITLAAGVVSAGALVAAEVLLRWAARDRPLW